MKEKAENEERQRSGKDKSVNEIPEKRTKENIW